MSSIPPLSEDSRIRPVFNLERRTVFFNPVEEKMEARTQRSGPINKLSSPLIIGAFRFVAKSPARRRPSCNAAARVACQYGEGGKGYGWLAGSTAPESC